MGLLWEEGGVVYKRAGSRWICCSTGPAIVEVDGLWEGRERTGEMEV